MIREQYLESADSDDADVTHLQLKHTDKTPYTYDQKTFRLDGKLELDITFQGRQTMLTPVYLKMDAHDSLLLSEGVCRQLGIISYHPTIAVCQLAKETAPSNSRVSGIRVRLSPHSSNDKARGAQPASLKVSEWVLVRFSQDEQGRNRKLSRPWHGPYRIASLQEPDVCIVKVYFSQNREIQINQARVKSCPPNFPAGVGFNKTMYTIALIYIITSFYILRPSQITIFIVVTTARCSIQEFTSTDIRTSNAVQVVQTTIMIFHIIKFEFHLDFNFKHLSTVPIYSASMM